MYECKSCGYHSGSKSCSFCGSRRTRFYLVPAERKFLRERKRTKKRKARRIISRWGL